jgi:Ser/Thr protein kinase RdoA (MazF antagonist)
VTDTVKAALRLWGLEGAPCQLVAARENAVYRVEGPTGPLALRLHRQGYRSDAELRSELQWMAAAKAGGLRVPEPLPAQDGALLCHVTGTQVDLLGWLDGQTLTETLQDATPAQRQGLFRALGGEMARLHALCDAWNPPPAFTRAAWDSDGLLGDAPLWDRFWRNPALSAHDHALFQRFRDAARADLARLDQLDYGLIHADLVGANVLVAQDRLSLIDFDDGGFGCRLFDLATALLKHRDAPDYPVLCTALIAGYHGQRPLDVEQLDLFLALRAMTYVGWNITRMAEPGGAARNTRFITTARDLARRYLTQTS